MIKSIYAFAFLLAILSSSAIAATDPFNAVWTPPPEPVFTDETSQTAENFISGYVFQCTLDGAVAVSVVIDGYSTSSAIIPNDIPGDFLCYMSSIDNNGTISSATPSIAVTKVEVVLPKIPKPPLNFSL